jgi:putative phage tail fiber protein
MAKKYYSTLTKIGLNAIARATTMNEKVKFSKFCLGDAEIHPDVNTTALGHEVWQGSLSSIAVDENNPNWIVLTCIISATVGGFTIREVGIKDEDGNLLAVASYPETYKPVLAEGAGKDLIVRVILEVSNTECVELKIDPTVSLATRSDLEEIEKKKANKEEVKKLEKKVEDAEKKVETVERKVAEGIESSDVSSKPIEFVEVSTRILPQSGDSIKTIVAKVTKYLKELKTVAFTGRYSDLTGVPTSFTPVTHYHDDRYLGKTSKASDSYKLDGYNSSYFAKSSEVGQLQSLSTSSKVNLVSAINELFRLSVDGKQSHINGINRLLGSSSGLTTNSSWNDIKYWWESKVFFATLAKKEILIDKILNNVDAHNITQELPTAKLYKKFANNINNEFEIYRGPARVVILCSHRVRDYDGAHISSIYTKKTNENLDISAYSRVYRNVYNGNRFKIYDRITLLHENLKYFTLAYDRDIKAFNNNVVVFIRNNEFSMNLYGDRLQLSNDGVFAVYTLDEI